MELGQQAARTGARLKAAGPREEAGCGLAVAQAADGRRRESGRAQACSQSIGRIGPRDGGEGGEDAELELDEDNFGEEEATENLGGRETDLIGSESSSESRSVEFRAGEEEDLMLLSRYNLIEDTYDCFRVESNGDSNDNRPRVSPSVASRARLEHRKLAIERRLKRRQVCGEFMPIGSRFGEKGPAPLPNGRRLRAANQMMNSLTESCCGAGEQQFSAGQGARRLLLLDGEAIERSEGSVNCASSNRSASSASYASTLSTASASTRHSNSISPSEQPALTLAASPLADFEDGRPELEFELAGSSFGGAAGQEQDLGLAQLHGRERRQSADGLALANWQASRAERASVHRRRQQQRASAWQPAESPSRQVGAGAEAEEGAEAYGNGAENENENNHVVVVVESETPSSSSGGRSATSKARTQSDQGESTKAPPVSATEPLAKQDERRQQQIGRLHHMETQAAPDLVPKRPHSPLAGDISSSEAKRDFSSSAERQAQQSGESCQRRPRQVGASAVDNIATLTQSNCAGAGQRNQYSNCSNRCDESDAIQANNCHSQQQQQQLIELEEEAETTLPGSENNNICSSSSSSSRIDKLPSRHDRLSGEREEFESDSKTEAAPSGRQQELNREHMSAVAAIGQAPQLAENNSIEQRAAQRKLIALKVARSGVGRSDDRPKLAADSMPTSSSTPPTNFSSSSSTSSVGSTTSSSVTTNLSFNSGSNNMISAGYQSPVAFCNQTAAYAVGQSQLLDVDSSRGKSQLQQQQRLGSNDTIYDQQQERSSVPVELKQLPLKQEQQTNHQFAQQQSRQQQQQPQYPQYPPNHPLGNTKHLCSICGDRATGKHYGVFSCEGCKGFFKRTIRKDIIYVCRSRGDCLIDMRQRNRCQYCRYQKCLRQGMKREAVQEEKQRLKLRAAAAAVAAGSITTSVTTNNNSSIFKLIDSNNNNSNCDINNNTFSMSEHNNNNNNNINNMIATHAGPNAHPSAPTQPHLNQFPSPVGGYTNQTQDYNASSNNNSAQLNHQNSIQHFNTVTSNYLHFKQDQNSLAHQQQLHLHQTGLSQFEAPSNNAHDLQLLNHQNPFELHQTHVNTQARTSSGSSSSSSSSTVSSSNCFAANNLNYPIGQAYSTIAQQQQPQISPASINTQTRLPVMRESYGNYYNTSGCLGGSESGSTTSSMSSTSHDQGLGAYLKPSKRLNSRIDELTLKWAAQCQIESLLEWAKSVPKFKELLIDDQITLLKAYWNELIISDIAFKSVDSIKENNQKQQRSLCIGRNLFIHESQSHEIGLSNVFERIVNDIVLKIHDMRIDSNELACLRAIILFNPETQGLKTSQPIEELRANVYTSLEAYCRKNYENQPNRFGKLLLRLPDLRSIGLKCDSIRRDNLDQNNNSSSNSNFKTSFNGCDQFSPNTPQQTTTPMNPFGTSNNFNNVNGLNSPPSANQFHHNHNHHLHHHYHGTHTAGSGPANSSTKLQGYQVKLLFFDICYESSAIDSFLRSNLSR